MIIQNPELLIYKRIDAIERLGEYFVALVAFKNGLVFGSKFSERQSKPGQWLAHIGPSVMVGGIGDLRDFKSAMLALDTGFCQPIFSMIDECDLTGAGVVKFVSGLLRQTFEEKATALAVNFIVADCHDENNSDEPDLWFVDFDGSIKQLRNFAVAGGGEYEKALTQEELQNLNPVEKSYLEFQKNNFVKTGMPKGAYNPVKLYSPRKEAIAYLEKNWKKNMKKEEAVELVKKTLFDGPESREKIFEIIAIEYGKESEIFYFKKE